MSIPVNIRRLTAAEWTAKNPILPVGDFGYELGTNRFKIGNGMDDWSKLLYFTNETALTSWRWDDLRISLLAATKGVTPPDVEVFRGAVKSYAFDKNIAQSVHFDVQLPHAWVLGTAIEPHVHWSPGNSTDTGVVRWQLTYTWANYNGVFADPTVLAASDQASDGVAYSHHISDLGTIDGTGKRASSILMCTLTRVADATEDTFDGDIFGLSVDFHIKLAGDGSVTEYGGT